MPSYDVGAKGEGIVSALLDVVQRKRARQEAQEDEYRKWNYDAKKILLQDPGIADAFKMALISGQDTTGIPMRSDPFDTSTLTPGQSYSQRVGSGTLSTQGPPRPEGEAKERRRDAATATTLRKQLDAYPEVKNFVEVRTQLDLMDNVYTRWKSGEVKSANTIDQALINTFGRMVDPGVSIREAEYQRTPDNVALINRMDAAFQRLKSGGVINDAEREGLMQVARIIAEARAVPYNQRLSEYETLASEYGIDPKWVTLGRAPYAAPSQAFAPLPGEGTLLDRALSNDEEAIQKLREMGVL